ncbi:hypothetical protein EV13_0364 [Prochlorococcus sp. MIT 0702]|nr:hypothetical protein EV12_0110 [Prochlorococcus sp. MIT 0701]KGG30344.1 hypothetical protein EV13_0364 [Prochlorococcus sp. MIT 0702]KGG35762.1 hypothetical protein EV14_0770 [Prochlorococcus sp. MIT 0703]
MTSTDSWGNPLLVYQSKEILHGQTAFAVALLICLLLFQVY